MKEIYTILTLLILTASMILMSGCIQDNTSLPDNKNVPHLERWGIYALDLISEDVELIYSSSEKISTLDIDNSGNELAFSQRIGGNNDSSDDISPFEEILTMNIDGSNLRRLTNNSNMDIRPVWSPDSSKIIFLRFGDSSLDIYIMDANGTHQNLLYDSGYHDADIHWVEDTIVFTSNSQIWSMKSNGTEPTQITNPPKAGQWGNANLPFGDYDPRLSPDGALIVFERLENDSSPHGNYNLFIINHSGTGETRLTNTGYSQGLASWSHSGNKILYIVGAINGEGKYDIFIINSDGTNNQNITPDYFPDNFLCQFAVFSSDDSKIFFIGEWWE